MDDLLALEMNLQPDGLTQTETTGFITMNFF